MKRRIQLQKTPQFSGRLGRLDVARSRTRGRSHSDEMTATPGTDAALLVVTGVIRTSVSKIVHSLVDSGAARASLGNFAIYHLFFRKRGGMRVVDDHRGRKHGGRRRLCRVERLVHQWSVFVLHVDSTVTYSIVDQVKHCMTQQKRSDKRLGGGRHTKKEKRWSWKLQPKERRRRLRRT